MKQLIFAIIILIGISVLSSTGNAQTTKYIVVNGSGVTLSSVYVEPAGTTTWTTNVYSLTDPFVVNGTYEFVRAIEPSKCLYDIKYIDVNGNEYYERNVNLCTGSSITLPQVQVVKSSELMKSVTIKNNIGVNITAFYIAPPGTTYWSNNLSNRDKIYMGETFTFLQKLDNSACNYDIKIVSDDGSTYILPNNYLCNNTEVVFVRPDIK